MDIKNIKTLYLPWIKYIDRVFDGMSIGDFMLSENGTNILSEFCQKFPTFVFNNSKGWSFSDYQALDRMSAWPIIDISRNQWIKGELTNGQYISTLSIHDPILNNQIIDFLKSKNIPNIWIKDSCVIEKIH